MVAVKPRVEALRNPGYRGPHFPPGTFFPAAFSLNAVVRSGGQRKGLFTQMGLEIYDEAGAAGWLLTTGVCNEKSIGAVVKYMGWKWPTRRQIVAVGGLIVALVVFGMIARTAVTEGRAPGWATIPFRSFTVGFFVELTVAVLIFREVRAGQMLPRVVLALAAFVAAASDGWDFFAEAAMGPVWTDSPIGLRVSLFVSQMTDAINVLPGTDDISVRSSSVSKVSAGFARRCSLPVFF